MGEIIDNEQEHTPAHILHAALEFIRPTRTEVMYFLLAGVGVTFLSRLTWGLEQIGIDKSSLAYARDVWTNSSANIQEFSDISSTAGTAVLWFVIGSIIYLFIWGVTVAIIDGYNDIVVSNRFLHPRSFHRSDYWSAIAGRVLVRVSGFIFLIALLMWSLSRLIVARFNDAYHAWDGGNPLEIIVRLLVNIALTALLLHAFTVCLRLLFLKRRLYVLDEVV